MTYSHLHVIEAVLQLAVTKRIRDISSPNSNIMAIVSLPEGQANNIYYPS